MDQRHRVKQPTHRYRILPLGVQVLLGAFLLSYAGYNVWSLDQHEAQAHASVHLSSIK